MRIASRQLDHWVKSNWRSINCILQYPIGGKCAGMQIGLGQPKTFFIENNLNICTTGVPDTVRKTILF